MALDKLLGMMVFCRAVECGSLAAAGRILALSPEMAGQHLKALEGRLNVRLLHRTTRNMSLTEAGRSYYTRCVAILDEITVAETEACSRQIEPRGHLRIAAPLAFGSAILAPIFASFLDRHPGISIDVDLSERPADLLRDNIDIALRLGKLSQSSMIARRLASFSLIPVAAPSYLSGRTAPVCPSDLTSHSALIYTQTPAPTQWSFTGPSGEKESVLLTGSIRASDIGFLVELAREGQGILLAPDFVVQKHLESGNLLRILPQWHERSLPLHALWPNRTLVSAPVRALIDFLAEWFTRAS